MAAYSPPPNLTPVLEQPETKSQNSISSIEKESMQVPASVIVAVKKSTMNESMEQHAMRIAFKALSKFPVEKDAAKYIKQEFDSVYGRQWHCVVGQHFGCYVSHFLTQFVYFYMNSIAVMLYRTSSESVRATNQATLPKAENNETNQDCNNLQHESNNGFISPEKLPNSITAELRSSIQ
ncbi:dynein light chain type 1 domain-containing protein [Ditylenchus destructor]|uniref:Dynein light chain n=1 Tax=Ditylenchus destructor TaxID=166010 RepID=A0AAD4NCX7_9BILA|nr:dynein light chain type 1 domain-containing protein [Ditylenchus destructor]